MVGGEEQAATAVCGFPKRRVAIGERLDVVAAQNRASTPLGVSAGARDASIYHRLLVCHGCERASQSQWRSRRAARGGVDGEAARANPEIGGICAQRFLFQDRPAGELLRLAEAQT